ncbi:MAG TPA: DUF5615 family PIN-like protein [Ardenticatenaceae bacterium]|nr:DUF5615 family PIN-like protein [Ardenticatenaceae bacterium]
MPDQPLHLFASVYTDEDVTTDLAIALRARLYLAESAAEAGNLELSDEEQLAYAAQHGMAILTYNIRDFAPLAEAWYFGGREHAGIIVSEQFSQEEFGELLRRMLRLLDRRSADDLRNRITFLQEFKR